MQWEGYDRYGNPIYITYERWFHALEKRPWLADHLDGVIDTIRHGRRQQDPLNAHKYKYYLRFSLLEPEFNHLVVVVLFGERENEIRQMVPNNYVVNIWAIYRYS